MEQIYKSLRSLITDELIGKIAKQLNAKESDISRAVSATFAGFLELTQKHGDTLQIRNVFEYAGSIRLLPKIKAAHCELLAPGTISIGDNFLQRVLGDRAAGFTTGISMANSLPESTINALIAALAPIFVGYVGDKLLSNQWSMHKFLGLISNQKGMYKEFIPVQVYCRIN